MCSCYHCCPSINMDTNVDLDRTEGKARRTLFCHLVLWNSLIPLTIKHVFSYILCVKPFYR